MRAKKLLNVSINFHLERVIKMELIDVSSIWLWFSVSAILLIIEMVIPGTFFSAIFSVSAFLVGLLTLLTHNFTILIFSFVGLSLIGTFFVKPLLVKFFKINVKVRDSNIDALIGKTGIVTKAISDTEKGYVKVSGEEWSALHINGERIKVGEQVVIKKLEGVTIYVDKFIPEGGDN